MCCTAGQLSGIWYLPCIHTLQGFGRCSVGYDDPNFASAKAFVHTYYALVCLVGCPLPLPSRVPRCRKSAWPLISCHAGHLVVLTHFHYSRPHCIRHAGRSGVLKHFHFSRPHGFHHTSHPVACAHSFPSRPHGFCYISLVCTMATATLPCNYCLLHWSAAWTLPCRSFATRSHVLAA